MKRIKMKIRPQFLPLIKNGIKKNEYRLAAPKYNEICIGDIICLINNQNSEDYIKVVVNKIYKFNNWDEAFKNRWETDFKGLYSSYDELLKECYKFYTQEEVNKYGIEVFEINLYEDKKINNAKYLFDTNIIVERESFSNSKSEVALMFNSIEKLHGKTFYHPLTKKELETYADEKIKNAMIKKLNAYEMLIPSDDLSKEFNDVCNKYKNDENSKADNEILLQVYNGRVDFLITEDRTILRKAKDLLIRDNVLTCNELLIRIDNDFPSLIDYDVLSVKLQKIGELDFNDNFFDTLREDYDGSKFNAWLERKSNEDAYVFKDKNGLQGFLYLKLEDEKENYSFFDPILSPKKRLKVGTFKINSTGIRLGERFLKIIFDNAIKQNVDEIYVTLFKNKRENVLKLMNLMNEWGFVEKSKNINNGEVVLIKDMKHYNYEKNPKFNYPLYDKNKEIGVLPILDIYHTKLFPDLHFKNENMEYFNNACSYAIEKIYVCGTKYVKHQPGDLLCIYRMANVNKMYRSVMSGISIISEIYYPQTIEEYLTICKNRTVFSEEELKKFFEKNKYRTIIKLLILYPFNKKVNLNDLYEKGILNSDFGPRLNTKIFKEKFEELKLIGMEKD